MEAIVLNSTEKDLFIQKMKDYFQSSSYGSYENFVQSENVKLTLIELVGNRFCISKTVLNDFRYDELLTYLGDYIEFKLVELEGSDFIEYEI